MRYTLLEVPDPVIDVYLDSRLREGRRARAQGAIAAAVYQRAMPCISHRTGQLFNLSEPET